MVKRKIPQSQHLAIFNLHAEGWQNKEIAHKFNVNPSCISKILHRKFQVKTNKKGHKNGNSKLRPEDVEKMLLYRKRGYTYGTLSVLFGVGISACSRIVNKKRWSKQARIAS